MKAGEHLSIKLVCESGGGGALDEKPLKRVRAPAPVCRNPCEPPAEESRWLVFIVIIGVPGVIMPGVCFLIQVASPWLIKSWN